MKIGEDFDKIQFDFMGLDLLEPNAFVGDTLIFLTTLFLAQRVRSYGLKNSFYTNWYWFFILFGFGFFIGGLGHLFYNYVGLAGKYAPLYIGIVSAVYIERAMISLLPNEATKKLLYRLVWFKLVLALCAATLVFANADLVKNPSQGLIVTSVNAAIGSAYALVYLGIKYARSLHPSFHFMWIAVLTMVPTAVVQGLKFSPAQWFDRNDLSHLFVIVTCILYYQGIKGYRQKSV